MLPSKHSTKTKYTLADLDRQLNGGDVSVEQDNTKAYGNVKDNTNTNIQDNTNSNIQHQANANIQEHANTNINAVENDIIDEDFEMIDVDNEQVQSISNYLAEQRSAISVDLPDIVPTGTEIITQSDKTIFVVDTNFVISHLNTLEELRKLSHQFNHVIVAPITTVRELDGLKTTDDPNIAKLARFGNDWLFRNLGTRNSGIVGQRLNERLNPNAKKDDAILDCCLYLQQKLNHKLVILLSNDKNLCLKALAEGLLTVSYRPGMTADMIAETAYNENVSRFGQQVTQIPKLDFSEVSNLVYNETRTILLTLIDHIMKEAYGDDIIATNYEQGSLKSFEDAGRTIAHFWLTVFADYFQRYPVRNKEWKNLPDTVLKVPQSTDDMKNFFEFWEQVLNKLIVNLGQNDKNVVRGNIEKWNKYIASTD